MQVNQNKNTFKIPFVIGQRTDIVKGAVLCQFLPSSATDDDAKEEGATSSETRKRSRSPEPET